MPLLWYALAFLGGLALGNWLKWSWQIWLGVTLVCLALVPLLRRLIKSPNIFNLSPLILAILPVIFFAGALRIQLAQPVLDPSTLAWYNDRGPLKITGVITSPPDQRTSYTYLRLQVRQVGPPTNSSQALGSPVETSQAVKGTLLAMVLPGGDWRYGDLVELTGSLETPPEESGFSFKDYLARQGIYSYLEYPQVTRLTSGQGSLFWAWIYAFKSHALSIVYRIFPQPESALMAGILLGDDSRISPTLQQAYQATGTAHIIAISGFNIAILAGLFSTLFTRLLGRRWGAVAAAVGITFYTVLVGANPSVVRAAIMGCLGLLATQVGRRQMGLNSLALTALVMCLFNPNLPWDVSFQLTFMATLGLVLFAQPFQEAFNRLVVRWLPKIQAQNLTRPVGDYILFTLAAQLVSIPVMVYHFQNLSLVSVIANPLVLPPQPLVEVLGGLALLGGLVHPLLGQLLGYIAWSFMAYTNRMVEWLASIPHGLVNIGQTSIWIWVIFYGLLFGLTFSHWTLFKNWREILRKLFTPQVSTIAPQIAIFAVAILAVLAWSATYSAPDNQLHLTLFDGGPPGTLLIRTPTGRSVLVVGGAMTSDISESIGRKLPVLDRQVDFLVVASAKDKDLPSVSLSLDDFPIRRVLWAGVDATGQGAASLQEELTSRSIPQTIAIQGQALDLGGGARLSVLSQVSTGVILLLEWNQFRALLPVGTVEDQGAGLTAASSASGPVDVLLLAGNGSPVANPGEMITKLNPQVMLLNYDVQGCPANCPPLLDMPGYTLLRTDQNGWIEVTTDGTQMWVEVEKK